MFNQQINNLVNAGYSPDDIEAWRVQRRKEMVGLEYTDNEIDNEIGRETRGTFNNQAWRTVFEKPEYVKSIQPKELRPVWDAANEMEGGAAAEKYAVTAFMAQKYDLDPKALLMHYDLAMEKYFGEVLTPQEHYRKIGEMINPARPKPEETPTAMAFGAHGAMAVPIVKPKWTGDPETKKAVKDASEKFRVQRLRPSKMSDESWEEAKRKGLMLQSKEFGTAERQLEDLNDTVQNFVSIPGVPDAVAGGLKATLIAWENTGRSQSDASMGLYSAIKDYAAEWGMGQRTEEKMEATDRFQRTVNGMFRQLAAGEQDKASRFVSTAMEAVDQMVSAVALGGVVGAPAVFGAQAVGNAYSSLRDANIDPSVAAPVAIVTGAITGAIENMVSFIPGARTWLKAPGMFTKMAMEIVEEGADSVNRTAFTEIVAKKLQSFVNMSSDKENAEAVPEDVIKTMAWDSVQAMKEAAPIIPVLALTGGLVGGASMGLQRRTENLPSMIDQRQEVFKQQVRGAFEENDRRLAEQDKLRQDEAKAKEKQSAADRKKADEDAREYLLSQGVPAKTIAGMKSEQLQQAVAAKKTEGTPSTAGVEQINAEVRATQAGETLAEQKPAVDAINADVQAIQEEAKTAEQQLVVRVSDKEYRDMKQQSQGWKQANKDVDVYIKDSTVDVTQIEKVLEQQFKDIPKDGESSGNQLKKARLKALMKMLKQDVDPTERRKWNAAIQDVVKNGTIERVDAILDEIETDPNRLLSDEESIAVNIRLNEREDEWMQLTLDRNQALKENKPATVKELDAEIDRKQRMLTDMTSASLKARSRAGRALAVGRWRGTRKFMPAMFQYVVERSKGSKLDKVQDAELITKLEEITKKYAEIEAENIELAKKLEDTQRKVLESEAKKETGDIIRKRRNRTREQNQAERQDILKEFAKLGHRVNEAMSSLGMGIEGLSLMSRLIRTYVEDGLTEMDEIVDRVKNDLPDATEFDVWSALAAKRNQTERVEKAATKMMAELKKQAKLMLEVDALERGEDTTSPDKPKTTPSDTVKALREKVFALRKSARETELNDRRLAKLDETVNKLEDMLENEHRAIKEKRKPDPETVAKRKEKIKELRQMMRIQDRISDLENQIETKNFGIFEPERVVEVVSEEMMRNRVKLRKLEKEVRLMADKVKPKGVIGTVTGAIAEPTQAMRMLAAGGELSMVLRQGLFMVGYMAMTGQSGLAKTGTVLSESLKAMVNQERFDQIFLAISEDPKQFFREQAELDITDPMNRLNEYEENFGIKALGKIPWIKLSERQGVSFINLMRIAMFDAGVDMHPEWNKEQLKLWAGWVNAVSGRSRLKDFITPQGMDALSVMMFAPNFAASRIETILRAGYTPFKDPGLAKEVGRTIAGYTAFNAMFYGMMFLAGGDIGKDPEEFDFGRMSLGNTKFDLFAGMNTPIRAFALSVMHLGAAANWWDFKGRSFTESAASFIRNKQAPLGPYIMQMITGKDFWGQDKPRWQTTLELFPPMYWKQIWESSAAGSFWSKETLASALMGVVGGGVTTIDNDLLQPRVRELYKDLGIGKITRLEFPKEIKEDRDLIAEREKLNKAFFTEVAEFLVKERKYIQKGNKTKEELQDYKDYVNEVISTIREDYKYQSEDLKKGTK